MAALPGAGLRDEDVPGLVRDLDLPGLVDLHVHFMPQRVFDKVWAFFDAAERTTGVAWPIHYREDEARRLARLQALGVQAFPNLLYPHKPGMAEWLNGWEADFAERTPGCVPSATFFPEPSAAGYVDAALDRGVRLWKAHLQVGNYDPRDPLLRPVWGRLAEAGTPVVVHAGSGPHPGRFTGPGPLAEVICAHPGLVVIVAHMGTPEYSEFLGLARRHDTVHLDTTMAFTDFTAAIPAYPVELLADVRELGLAGRVVLGSDFPNTPYPYAHQIESLVRLDLGADWLRAVLHDNGARLLDKGGTS